MLTGTGDNRVVGRLQAFRGFNRNFGLEGAAKGQLVLGRRSVVRLGGLQIFPKVNALGSGGLTFARNGGSFARRKREWDAVNVAAMGTGANPGLRSSGQC